MARHLKCAQQPGQRLRRVDRFAAVIAAQVHEQLPVGESVRDLVRQAQRQGGLADAGRAAEQEHHDGLRAVTAGEQPRRQRVQFLTATGEQARSGRSCRGGGELASRAWCGASSRATSATRIR